MKKKILVLGSTGSIGKAALELIEDQRDTFELFGIVCKENVITLNEQIEKYKPLYVGIYDASKKPLIRFDQKKIFSGKEGIRTLIGMDVDIVLNSISGSAGLEPTIEAIKARKVLALANKESIVMAGRIISKLLKIYGAKLIPIDSEHSALFQLLKKVEKMEVSTLIITCSGGPFKDYDKGTLSEVRPEEALAHPIWKMGEKISIDSATLMNKAFEVIEVRWLFDIEPERIKVLIHPEGMIHGIVEFIDGSLFCYMAYPEMKIPISYAINEERKRILPAKRLDFHKIKALTFYPPDPDRFPAINIGHEALKIGDSASVVINAANEVTLRAFIEGKIKFLEIYKIVREVLENHSVVPVIEDIEKVLEIHRWAVDFTKKLLRKKYA